MIQDDGERQGRTAAMATVLGGGVLADCGTLYADSFDRMVDAAHLLGRQ